MNIFGRKKADTLEARLEKLAGVGIHLAPGRSADELLESWSREELETGSYFDLVLGLGLEVEAGPSAGAHYTDQLFTLDAECIEDRGDYVRVFRDLERLFQGEVPLTELEDQVDIGQGQARISLTTHGQSFEHAFPQEDDWLSEEAIRFWVSVVDDIRKRHPDKITRHMGSFSDGGQGIVFVCLRPADLKAFRKLTRIDVGVVC